MASDDRMPEGTETIIAGAGTTGFDDISGKSGGPRHDDADAAPRSARETFEEVRAKATDKTAELRGQAAGKARDYALVGKDRAVEGLDNVQRLINEAADTVDAKVGEQYGAYVRQAADQVATFSDALRDKGVDELVADARDIVRKSPAVAIGAAAAIGFVVSRIVKAGLEGGSATPPADGGVGAPSADRSA